MELKSQKNPVMAVPLDGNEDLWREFLARSTNGTLFHDLDFLRYHPHDRFRFQHLMLMRGGEPVALFPGGLEESVQGTIFCSSLGASVGGLAVAANLSTKLALDMVTALQDYARHRGWAGIRVTLPPLYYSFETAGLIEFALFYRGFRLKHRWLCPVIRLDAEPEIFSRKFKIRQISPVRAARRKGVRCVEVGLESFNEFILPFRDTYSRHGTQPTHSEDEIRDLLTRLPNRIRVHLAKLDDIPIAALLVFHVTRSVATTFYICRSAGHLGANGPAILIANAMDRLGEAGFRYLDLGPSASDHKINDGNTFFKEGLGAVGHCRDRWQWDIEA